MRIVAVVVAAAVLALHNAMAQTTRDAKPMSLAFFEKILYTAVGNANEAQVNETQWQEHAESNWARATNLSVTEGKKFPFIVCDSNDTIQQTSPARRQAMGEQALGLPSGSDLTGYFVTIYNVENTTCVLASLNATIAATLPWIVQPLSFLMKINSGSLEFTDADASSDTLQYAVYYCPGLDNLNRTWALNALQIVVPLIPLLVQVPEAAIYKDDLEQLQTVLTATPDFCDGLLIDNVVVEDAGEYNILTFDLSSAQTRNSSSDAETCFHLLVFALAFTPEVCFMERRVKFESANTNAQWITQSGIPNHRPFFDAGITGEGQIVAVSDTGLDLQSCYFKDAPSVPTINFGTNSDLTRRKVVQYVDYVNNGEVRDGHGSHVAGTIAGRKSTDGANPENGMVDGVAKDARIAFFDIGKDDATHGLLVPSANTLLNPGYQAGARIHSASWGSSADFYTTLDRDLDRYIYQDEDMLVIFAAGNEGPSAGTVRSPALAKNVLTVGASTSAENDIPRGTTPVDALAGFSSIGPSMDERIKPDVVASGQYILSVGSRPTGPSCDPSDTSGLPGPGGKSSSDSVGILSLQGTSMATPVVSGNAALIRQYFELGFHGNGTQGSAASMEPSGTLLKAILVNGAQPLAGYALNEVNAKQGFGRISLIDSLPLATENDLIASFKDKERIVNAQTKSYTFTLPQSNKTCDDAELSVTLVWTDPPGYIGCMICTLNDLDLFVAQTMINGTQRAHYPNGRTVSKDPINNVERVRFKATVGDSFVVTVTAAHLEGTEQTYSLAAVYGCLNHRNRAGITGSGASTASTMMWASVLAMTTLWFSI